MTHVFKYLKSCHLEVEEDFTCVALREDLTDLLEK